jgi:hypothetical protein
MDQPAHLLASRRHAEKAISSGGGNGSAVPGRQARTEALLVVAAATGRLAGAGPRLPGRRHPQAVLNSCMPWTADADAALLAACQGRTRHADAR